MVEVRGSRKKVLACILNETNWRIEGERESNKQHNKNFFSSHPSPARALCVHCELEGDLTQEERSLVLLPEI